VLALQVSYKGADEFVDFEYNYSITTSDGLIHLLSHYEISAEGGEYPNFQKVLEYKPLVDSRVSAADLNYLSKQGFEIVGRGFQISVMRLFLRALSSPHPITTLNISTNCPRSRHHEVHRYIITLHYGRRVISTARPSNGTEQNRTEPKSHFRCQSQL
jgi:hypothetical protein